MTTRWLAVIAIGLWLVSAAGGAFLFVRGQTEVASDGRTAVKLSPQERDVVLKEMRTMLESVRDITRALADGDAGALQKASRASGRDMQGTVPAGLMLKLPLAFKDLGFAVHAAFDEITVASQQQETPDMIMGKLADQLARCAACHGAYRLP